MAEKKTTKKTAKKETTGVYKITKDNGNIIERGNLSATLIKRYEDKGWKVEKG